MPAVPTSNVTLLRSICEGGRCSRADPEAPRNRRQPAQTGRRPGEGARELRAGARGAPARPASRTRSARSSRSGSPTSSGSLRESPPPSPPARLTSWRSAAARAAAFGHGQRRRAAQARRRCASSSTGSTSTPASGGTNSGGPPIRVATTERPEAIASSSAWPSGSIRLGWQTTWRGGDSARDPLVRDGARELDTRPALELRTQRPVADERQRPLAQRRERVGKPDDVLPLDERRRRRGTRGPGRGAGCDSVKRSRSTPESTTSVFPRASGHLRFELARAGSPRRRSPPTARRDDEPRRGGDPRDRSRCCARRGRAR